MSAHLFEQDSSPDPAPLRSQRMTADEAKAVIDLWQRERDEQTGLTDRPAVPDVAEGLDIGVEDVQRLLAEIRERRAGEERALAYEQELAEIRLAEEERKLAEVKRQRAELRRESVEAGRGTSMLYQAQTIPQRGRPLHARTQLDYRYKPAALIFGIVVYLIMRFVVLAPSSQPIHLSSFTTAHDAQGKIILEEATCKDGSAIDVPCDDETIARETSLIQKEQDDADFARKTAALQAKHDKQVADAKKQLHDRKQQAHRRDY